jgi:hypothetical protein
MPTRSFWHSRGNLRAAAEGAAMGSAWRRQNKAATGRGAELRDMHHGFSITNNQAS